MAGNHHASGFAVGEYRHPAQGRGRGVSDTITTCCGNNLLTPFCPMCGKANKDPALELVTFLRAKVEGYRTQAKARATNVKAAVTCNDKADRMERWANRVVELAH